MLPRVVDEVVGLGPIDGMIRDPSVSEVMVNAPDEVYFEREGIIYLSDIRFRDADHVQRIIERIVAPLGRRVGGAAPSVGAWKRGRPTSTARARFSSATCCATPCV